MDLDGRGIPRLDCLGLIEALSALSMMTHARFRGLIASASLKHGGYPCVTWYLIDSEA